MELLTSEPLKSVEVGPHPTTPTQSGLRVGIYCRISMDKRGDELGVQRQLDEARNIAASRG